MKLSENIKILRESHGLTQMQLGQIAGVSDKAVSTWEKGEKKPRMGAVQRMADYFNISKSALLFGDEEPATEYSDGPKGNVVKIAGRDGSYIEKKLSDADMQMLLQMIDHLPDASDDL